MGRRARVAGYLLLVLSLSMNAWLVDPTIMGVSLAAYTAFWTLFSTISLLTYTVAITHVSENDVEVERERLRRTERRRRRNDWHKTTIEYDELLQMHDGINGASGSISNINTDEEIAVIEGNLSNAQEIVHSKANEIAPPEEDRNNIL